MQYKERQQFGTHTFGGGAESTSLHWEENPGRRLRKYPIAAAWETILTQFKD